MTMPNFLIIGAGGAGTAAMHHILKQHPQIYMSPVKEPRFFAFEGDPLRFSGPGDDRLRRQIVTTLEGYLKLFEATADEIAIGEASPAYLALSEVASQRIQHYAPRARLIAILRQPADRAYSAYLNWVAIGNEPLSFPEALAAEQERRQKNWAYYWQYRGRGFYASLLRPYLERFPRKQLRFYLYEDWNAKPREVLQDIFRFLQVDDTVTPDVTRRNVTRLPRSRAIQSWLRTSSRLKMLLKPLLPQPWRHKLISGLQSLNQLKPPPLDPELRRELTEGYREDILKLQDIIGRDLSHWLES
jgi:hypothetical protein